MSSMIIYSIRKNFWNADHLAENDLVQQVKKVENAGKISFGERTPFDEKKLNGKKVLLIVHGFNCKEEFLPRPYFALQEALSKKAYDYVIGFAWPGGDQAIDYFDAKARTQEIAPRFLKLIERISLATKQLDIAAHSMGCRLTLQALNQANRPLIHNLILQAAAVDNEALDRKDTWSYRLLTPLYNLFGKVEDFTPAATAAKNIYLFCSSRDSTLTKYPLVSKIDRPLGLDGPENPEMMPSTVQYIDCTPLVDNDHSRYFDSAQVLNVIRNIGTDVHPTPDKEKRLRLIQHGEVPFERITYSTWDYLRVPLKFLAFAILALVAYFFRDRILTARLSTTCAH